jgi:hypothetical protein
MRMNRREMLKATGTTGLALATVGAAEGCNASQWIQTALTDLPTILQIITSILAVAGVNASAQVTEYGNEAKNDFTTAQSIIASYNAAASSAKPGLLGQIDAALSAGLANLSGILNAFHVNDQTLESTIAAAVGAAMTAVLAIQSLVPAPPAASAKRVALAKATQNNGDVVLRQAYNLIVAAHYPQAVI